MNYLTYHMRGNICTRTFAKAATEALFGSGLLMHVTWYKGGGEQTPKAGEEAGANGGPGQQGAAEGSRTGQQGDSQGTPSASQSTGTPSASQSTGMSKVAPTTPSASTSSKEGSTIAGTPTGKTKPKRSKQSLEVWKNWLKIELR